MSARDIQLEAPFYVTGGTLSRDALCYVTRNADHLLYDHLSKGHFCYVLTARQMGKSSLMVRIASRLRDEGAGVTVLDLTAIGHNLTPEQWYGGLLTQMAQQLALDEELDAFWDCRTNLGPLQRWMQALRQVVLPHYPGRVVIFIDEIDAVRSLPFSTDEFFAGLREFYNRRTEDPELERLNFCLLGVAAPSDLIRDTRMTPFNIGQRIELHDFTEAEAQVLACRLGGNNKEGSALLDRILAWTGGHPYLTQRFCHAVSESNTHPEVANPHLIDRLCEELFFGRRAREQDDNLLFVRERLLRSDVHMGALLNLYSDVLGGRQIEDDETNPCITILKLSGITRIEGGRLRVRNRIYERVFDQDWVARNIPTQLDPPAEISPVPDKPYAPAVKKRKIWLWATLLTIVLATASLVGSKMFNARSMLAVPNSYRDWEVVRLTRGGVSVDPAISPDGKFVAYVNHESGLNSIWLLQIATSTQQQLTPPDNLNSLDLIFSGDGGELYFLKAETSSKLGTLYRIPVLGGVARKLRSDIAGSEIMLSSDGAHLAFIRRREGKNEFVVANADGVEERVLLSRSLQYPAWSPDGDLIAFSVGSAESGGERMGIHAVRLTDGAEREITSQKWQHVGDKVWLPDGSGLIVSARDSKAGVKQLWFVAYPSGQAQPLSNDFDQFSHINLTPDGLSLVAEHHDLVSEIWSAPLSDVAIAKKVGVWGSDGLCVMPDGQIVYSTLLSKPTDKLWIMNPDGTDRRQLTFDAASDISPAASPDGRYIVFASNRTGNFDIWRMNPDGSNLLQLTHSTGSNPPSISSDGKWVIYLSGGSLYKIPIEGGEPARVCQHAAGFSAVSPDGNLIAYFSPGKENLGIAVSSFADGVVVRRFDVGSQSLNHSSLDWTPDGKSLLYSLSSEGASNIWRQRLDGSAPEQVTDFKADGIFRFDISSDGKQLICARGGWKHDVVLIKNFRRL